MAESKVDLGRYQLGWHDEIEYAFQPKKGLNREVVEQISEMKGEPDWMRKFRLRALEIFERKPMKPWFAKNMPALDFQDIYYYLKPSTEQVDDWEMLPDQIKGTYEKLGIPEAERKYLAGVTAQMESEVVYHRNREDLEQMGILFSDLDTALREYPEIVQEYIGTIIPPGDNKFAALNSAVWSGGSFIYVPEGVHVPMPLQAYFRINAENAGQFERTLIIVEAGASVHYVEGCLPGGELVAMADGDWRPIEEIRVGDRVLAHEGHPARVKAFQVRTYRGPLLRFRPISPASEFAVTPEHPLLVVRRADVLAPRKPRRDWKPEVSTKKLLVAAPQWVEAGSVKAGDFLVFPKLRPTPAEHVLSLEFARLAGYFLADGSATLTNGCKSLAFSFHIDDFESVEEVQRLCKALYDASGSVLFNQKKHEARVLVYTPAGYEAMRAHVGTRSRSKKLSSDLFRQDEEFLRHLVETYMRGDGNLIERSNGARWRRAHTTSRSWAHQLQAILARLDIFATVSLRRPAGPGEILGRTVQRHALYQVQWTEGGDGPREVRDAGEYFLVPVRAVTAAEFEGDVFNLDVDAPDSYLASGFAVHNCSAPVYTSDSLHSAVVEIVAKPGARVQYTTIQNWSPNVYNLVTKRARAEEEATVVWIDGNLGSKLTMKYPSVYLMGPKAHGEVLSVAYAGDGQHQDAGAKRVHAAPETSSIIESKSISKDGGRTTYRGLVRVEEGATKVKSTVRCDALILDEDSRSDTYPYQEIAEEDVRVEHEATVSKVGEDQLYYLMSRGLSETEAASMIVNGFIEPIVKTLPMEYAVELSRLIELEMEGAVG
ncbi:MAG: Fe-S cluster assembly protein SufB [Actinobacteria bacterium]|nr:Fe-S cluster assembly protein SufB [Actinomycetota bacterium]